LERDVIAPGDSAALEIVFNTGSYYGPVAKQSVICTNADTQTVKITAYVTVAVDAIEPVRAKPYQLDFTSLSDTLIREKSFDLYNVSTTDQSVSLVSVDSRYFEVTFPESIPAGKALPVTVHLTERALGSEFRKSITFAFGDTGPDRLTIPLQRTEL
jgi:hypothetical protein